MAAVSNKFRDLLQVSVSELLLVSSTGCWCLQGELWQESLQPRAGPCLTPGVLGRVQEGGNQSALRHGNSPSPFTQPHQLAAA